MKIIECPKCGSNISHNTEESEFCWICKRKLVKYDETLKQINERKDLEKQQRKIEDEKRITLIFRLVFIFMVLGFLLPSFILLVYNFFKLVVLGNMYFSEFLESWSQYSYSQVEDFYSNIIDWLKNLGYRLNN